MPKVTATRTRPKKKATRPRAAGIGTLRRRLQEAEETLRAITSGQVDALVVTGPQGDQVFTLQDADRPYRHLAEQMQEGACTLNAQGIVLFANSYLVRLLGVELEQVLGKPLSAWVRPGAKPRYARLLRRGLESSVRDEIDLVSAAGEPLPVQLSLSLLQTEQGTKVTVVIVDLRERKRSEQALLDMNQLLEQKVAERTAQLQVANEELRAANAALQVTTERHAIANEKLTGANRQLAKEITVRRQAEEAIQRHNALLEGINAVLGASLTCETERDLGGACLKIAEELTQSKFGFIGEIDDKGLEDIAVSNPDWDGCEMVDGTGHRVPVGSFELHGVYGRVLRDGRSLICNDVANHPDHIGFPSGHPPLDTFLGVPLLSEGRTIGIIAVGKREGGYTRVEQQALEALAPAFVEASLRMRAEESLRKSEEHYRRLFDTMLQGVVYQDANGTIVSMNAAAERILGKTHAEFLGHSSVSEEHDTLREDGTPFPGVEHPAMVALRTGRVVRDVGMRVYNPKEQQYRSINITAVPVFRDSEDPTPYQVYTVFDDVTERKRGEERVAALNRDLERRSMELANANRELESFAYSVSHDLRTPLAAIEDFIGLFVQEYGAELPTQGRVYLRLAQENAAATNRLVHALLTLSRTNRQPLKEETVNMRAIVDQVLEELRPAQAGRSVDIVLGTLPDVEADPVLIKQVWLNLVSNALKYTRPRDPARIEIGTEDRDGARVFFVRDNGVGFDMAHADNLFGVFQRLHSEEEFEGTGVGLAIVDRIARRHGGRVWAEAKVDQGATFHFTLG